MGFSFGNCLAHRAPAQPFQSAPRHAHTLTLLAPLKGAPRQPARKPGQVQPRGTPGRVYTNLFARGRPGKTLPAARAQVPVEVPGGQDSPAMTAGLGARSGGHAPASPGRQARSPAVPGAERPWRPHAPGRPAESGPTRPGHRTPPPGSPELRTSGLSRGSRASGRRAGAERAAGSGRAGGRAGAGLCTCSLARPEDSGRPPPGPKGARAAARPPPEGGVTACGAGTHTLPWPSRPAHCVQSLAAGQGR